MKISASLLASRVVQPPNAMDSPLVHETSAEVDSGSGPSREDRDKIKVAQQFEAIFVRQLLQQMQPDAASGAGGSTGGELYQGMGQEALAEHISTQSEGFGIAHSLLKHWGVKSVKHQEG